MECSNLLNLYRGIFTKKIKQLLCSFNTTLENSPLLLTYIFFMYDYFKKKDMNIAITLEVNNLSFILNLTSFFRSFNGPFLTVNQSMFTEVDVANQWHCRGHNNVLFVFE